MSRRRLTATVELSDRTGRSATQEVTVNPILLPSIAQARTQELMALAESSRLAREARRSARGTSGTRTPARSVRMVSRLRSSLRAAA